MIVLNADSNYYIDQLFDVILSSFFSATEDNLLLLLHEYYALACLHLIEDDSVESYVPRWELSLYVISQAYLLHMIDLTFDGIAMRNLSTPSTRKFALLLMPSRE